MGSPERKPRATFTAPKEVLDELPASATDGAADGDDIEALGFSRRSIIRKKESDYQARRLDRQLSPGRRDAFSKNDDTAKDAGDQENPRSYAEVMRMTQLEKEAHELKRKISAIEKTSSASSPTARDDETAAVAQKKRKSEWDVEDSAPAERSSRRSKWDETPRIAPGQPSDSKQRSSKWDQTPLVHSASASTAGASAWDQTPRHPGLGAASGEETPRKARSRWDETPVVARGDAAATPLVSSGAVGSATPNVAAMTPNTYQAYQFSREIDPRNKPWTIEDLDELLPKEGYRILEPPAGYLQIATPSRKAMAAATPQSGFFIQEEQPQQPQLDIPANLLGDDNLPLFRPEDVQHFGKLLDKKGEGDLTYEEAKERKIMRLLLRIKNGTPSIRKLALKQLTEKAREFGAGPLFNQILPLLMAPTLDEQERHLLVKVIDRLMFKLDDLVRPHVHSILVVIEPMLIDEDYYARIEGREIISNLSKAAGLATMISIMRPDIDHVDEYVRNTTARAFSVVASALGVPSLLPFLKAVCRSKKSWQARHTGVKIIQQIALLLGCAVLPHLRSLVEAIAHGLEDENQKVRTMTALAIAGLAESAAPYGIESFDIVLKPLWKGIRKHRGKGLAAFLKAIGFIIPLMDPEYANYYTREIMGILVREFQTPDEEMKKIVMRVVKQCSATEGVEPEYIKKEILPDFFKYFWVRRMALDKRNYRQLVDTTVELAQKVGVSTIISNIVVGLKDESEAFRKMVMEAIDKIISTLGSTDIDERLEELLIDGILYTFQEQAAEDLGVLDGFGTVVNSLGLRIKPYLPQICSTILWRLNNKNAKVRQQASDLIARVAPAMNLCGEEKLMGHLGTVLYEYLGEEYPEVLGSILGGLKAIVNVIGMARVTPPIKDLLPRLTPILRNRHEKVQENCIDLVGRIADRGAEFVSAREWMRICFELIDILKAPRKSIRRAAVNTFGYIARAIGPQDVLATLLSNLKVQERNMRICTTVAIAIVAETCGPFTVLPALMNEYRMPDRNIQNGVLKSLSFMFEYIGEMGKDYIYAVTNLLEDALLDRDRTHRQIACFTIKHMAIGCFGLGCEDALVHLLNLVWPNILETMPHTVMSVNDAIEGLCLALGAGTILQYCLQGLFHPARRIRDVYWRHYNNCYLIGQDDMVPFYPRVEDEGRNTYRRYELEYVI